jgi:hypothetical protein
VAGIPAARPRVMTGDQFRRQDDGPVWHAPADGGASAMAIRKTLSAAPTHKGHQCQEGVRIWPGD